MIGVGVSACRRIGAPGALEGRCLQRPGSRKRLPSKECRSIGFQSVSQGSIGFQPVPEGRCAWSCEISDEVGVAQRRRSLDTGHRLEAYATFLKMRLNNFFSLVPM
jgi:hypothetical protein